MIFLKTARRLVQTTSALYLPGLGLFMALRTLRGEELPVIALLNNFTHWYFVPAPLLMLGAALTRSSWTMRAAALPTLFMLITYGPRYLPDTAAPLSARDNTASTRINTLTFNTLWRNHDVDALVKTIMSAQADIIALQEVTPRFQNALPAEFNERYPYQRWESVRYGPDGAGFASSYPILEYSSMLFGGRGHAQQRIVVDIDGQPVVIYNVHLNTPDSNLRNYHYDTNVRTWQMNDLLPALDRETLPLILMGDFNLSDQSEDYNIFAIRYGDSFLESGYGMGLTWPIRQDPMSLQMQIIPPLLRIDYIWHSADFSAIESGTLQSSSDHRALQAALILSSP